MRANIIGPQVAIGNSLGHISRLRYDGYGKSIYEDYPTGTTYPYYLAGYICPECGAYNQDLDRVGDYNDLVYLEYGRDSFVAFCWRCQWANLDEEHRFRDLKWDWKAFDDNKAKPAAKTFWP